MERVVGFFLVGKFSADKIDFKLEESYIRMNHLSWKRWNFVVKTVCKIFEFARCEDPVENPNKIGNISYISNLSYCFELHFQFSNLSCCFELHFQLSNLSNCFWLHFYFLILNDFFKIRIDLSNYTHAIAVNIKV